MHLRDTYSLGDLGLTELAVESQRQNHPGARRQCAQATFQRAAPLDALVAVVTAHPAPRKWRLSSPRIVGTAKDENALPRSG